MTIISGPSDNETTSERFMTRGGKLRRFRTYVFEHKIRSFFYLILGVIVLDIMYLSILWPNWDRLAKGPIQESRFIREFKARQADLPKNKAIPVVWLPRENLGLSSRALRVFIMAEDSRFYEHHGVDLEALKLAFEYNWKKGAIGLGGSTITQQTVKNMFLSFSRNPLRKFHEILLALAMDHNLSKKRVLTIYLNIAEFGPGIFGLEAAARHYFHASSSTLTTGQLVALAASLPSPRKNNPATHTRSFARRQNKIGRVVDRYVAAVEPHPTAAAVQPSSPQNGTPPVAISGAPVVPPQTGEIAASPVKEVEPSASVRDELQELNFDASREDDRDETQDASAE